MQSKLKNTDDKDEYVARVSIVAYVFVVVIMVLLVLVSVIIELYFENFYGLGKVAIPVIVFCDCFYLAILFIQMLRFYFIEIRITNHKVLAKKGIINVLISEIALEKIDNIKFYQTFLGKICNYATIIVGSTATKIVFRYIGDAKQLKQAIDKRRYTLNVGSK